MNKGRIKVLYKRELRDVLRDKKTLFVMLVLPLILYPLLIIGMTLLISSIAQNREETVYKVAFVDVPDTQQIESLFEEKAEDMTYKVEFVEDVKDVESDLADRKLDAYVKYDASKKKPYRIHFYGAQDDSSAAELAVEELLDEYKKKLQEEKVESLGLDAEEILYPIRYDYENHSSHEQTIGKVLSGAIPMLLIVSIMMGAVYPAIDVTAGEKERGTLETLLTLPLTNFEMIMSKFFAVATIACISAFLNILSMGGAFGFMISYMADSAVEEMGGMSIELSSFLPAIGFSVFIMIFFALFASAICMCVCLFAKSFKEANNYVTPIMLVFMFAGYVTMVPNVELDAMTSTIPVVNISLMIAELFKMTKGVNYALFGVVLLSNIVYSLLAVMMLAKVYDSESVLFSEGLGSLKLFEKRSDMKEGTIPGVGDVLFLVCVQLILMFYIGTAAQVKLGFGGTAVVQLIILIVPIAYLWYLKSDVKQVLTLKRPHILAPIGALFMWVGTYAAVLLISMPLSKLMPSSAQSVGEMQKMFMEQPFWALALVVALMPAVGEELMFRGFIFGSLRDKMKPMTAMLITSAIFGIYHMSLIKFFTTALLGFAFVMVLNQTQSIFCTMMMHFLNNLVSVAAMKFQEQMKQIVPFLFKEELVSTDFVILGVVALVGIVIGWSICRIVNKSITKNNLQ